MNDWIVDSIKEEIEAEVLRVKNLNDMAVNLKDTYKGISETDDKFEVKYHEYWRTVELMTKNEIDRLNEILEQINEMKNEEVKVLEESYRDYEEKRSKAVGIL